MTLYSCKCGNTQEIGKQTIRYRDNGWRTIEARCECGREGINYGKVLKKS
jgi:hypothetical protein